MLTVSGLSKGFSNRIIFENFHLNVACGTISVLLGPSGCGKSTLFNTLTGTTPMDGGELSWKGAALPHLGFAAAYMQQKDLLLPWFTLMDNALLPVRVRGRVDKGTRERAEELFCRMGLEGALDLFPGTVSGGMRQRCALVRTLMFSRELILLDEPLSRLDAITRRDLQSLLLLFKTDFQKTMVMITHDVDEALFLADEIQVLSNIPMEVIDRVRVNHEERVFGSPGFLKLRNRILAHLGKGGSQ